MENKRNRWIAVILWLAAFTITMASLCWRAFLPNYFHDYPNAWRIWLKGGAAIFIITLFAVPTGIYGLTRRILQRIRLGRPWLLCLVLLAEILATHLLFGQKLNSSQNLAAALVISTLLFAPQIELEALEKPLVWLLPEVVFMLAVAALSFCLPWKGEAPGYSLAAVVTCALTAWQLVGTLRQVVGKRGRKLWLILLPVLGSYFVLVIQHVLFVEDPAAKLQLWLSGASCYSEMRGTDPVGTAWMNILLPAVNLILGVIVLKLTRHRLSIAHVNAGFLQMVYALISVIGITCFYGVFPDASAPVNMPHRTLFTCLPVGLYISDSLCQSFTRKKWTYKVETNENIRK